MNAFRVPFLLAACAVLASAQKKEDFLQIQRDVAQMQDQLKQLQKSQDDKMAALTLLVQQSLEANSKLASNLATLQTSLTTTLSEQQRGVVAPMAALSKEVESLATEFRSVQSNVTELGAQIGRLDGKLADISSAVRTLSTPPAAPPPPAASAEPQPPPGVTAEGLFENARRDYSAKRDDLAFQGFNDYLKYFPKTENAPKAQYFVGMLYDRAEQWEDAIKAFDAVLERWAENYPTTADALYMKAADQSKAKHNAEAIAEFKEFLSRYPNHDKAAQARLNLKNLGASPAPAKPAAAKRR